MLALAGCSEETEDKDNEQNKTSSVVVTPELSIEGEKTITEPADGESELPSN
ncbi:hypothetical protein [Pseudoalteromonas rubra]|uniref:hypothetical protein n=1 Tax=Pseudoalteromonas rubra TaxID=43658 RepID=UPI000B24DB71|nr:hypothetical protein [Pseudoalteromonas rubra]